MSDSAASELATLRRRLNAANARRAALVTAVFGTSDPTWRQRMEDLVAWHSVPMLRAVSDPRTETTPQGAGEALDQYESALTLVEGEPLPDPVDHPLKPPDASLISRFAGWFEGNDEKATPPPERAAPAAPAVAVAPTAQEARQPDVDLAKALAPPVSKKPPERRPLLLWLGMAVCLAIAVGAIVMAFSAENRARTAAQAEADSVIADLTEKLETSVQTLAGVASEKDGALARVKTLEADLKISRDALVAAQQQQPSDEVLTAENARLREEVAALRAALASAGTPDTSPVPSTPSLEPSHVVSGVRVNARAGPGTQNPIVARLVRDTPLSLVEETGSWGRFDVLSGDAIGQQVWIALRLTSPVQ